MIRSTPSVRPKCATVPLPGPRTPRPWASSTITGPVLPRQPDDFRRVAGIPSMGGCAVVTMSFPASFGILELVFQIHHISGCTGTASQGKHAAVPMQAWLSSGDDVLSALDQIGDDARVGLESRRKTKAASLPTGRPAVLPAQMDRQGAVRIGTQPALLDGFYGPALTRGGLVNSGRNWTSISICRC